MVESSKHEYNFSLPLTHIFIYYLKDETYTISFRGKMKQTNESHNGQFLLEVSWYMSTL